MKKHLFLVVVATLSAACGSQTGTTNGSAPAGSREPKVGMEYTAFVEMCKSETGDEISTTQTADGRTTKMTLKESPSRAGSGCVGTFTFDNGKLSVIQR